MRILLLTAGSRGDVEPFLALGRAATAAGHSVRIGVTREFAAAAEQAGLDVAVLDGDYAALVAAQGVSVSAALWSFRSTVAPMMAAILRSAARAAVAFRPDVIVHHPKVLSAPSAAASLQVPHVLAELVPTLTPSRDFAAAGVTTADLGRLNPLTYRVAAAAAAPFAGVLRELRSELGLPRRGGVPGPVRTVVPVSPSLLARPLDWPATAVVSGQWRRRAGDGEEDADAELDAFLAAGQVLYAGFGSMAAGDPAARGRALVTAARASGLRVLAVTGWGGIAVPDDLLDEDVLVRGSVAHRGVLPRCVAAVHHGGAGTVHAVAAAGIPSLVVPFLADQPFWAQLLHRRGLAAPPVPVRRVTTDRLRAAMDQLPAPTVARRVAERMRGEDGCAATLTMLTAGTPPRSPARETRSDHR